VLVDGRTSGRIVSGVGKTAPKTIFVFTAAVRGMFSGLRQITYIMAEPIVFT
jgi:hypothetical protein